jgi:hypothetical protein
MGGGACPGLTDAPAEPVLQKQQGGFGRLLADLESLVQGCWFRRPKPVLYLLRKLRLGLRALMPRRVEAQLAR